MQQRRKPQHQSQHLFTASEVGSFEYCSLSWWHERYDPMARGNDDELFARLVELEEEHDAQAPSLPEYQVIEQLLLRRGAFEEGKAQHREHAEEVAERKEERILTPNSNDAMRRLVLVIVALVVLALALIIASAFLH
ncbi:hypothetical protein KSD_20120 [Ktedonobacter sp. SOSP1-85]|uniref:hypothetical protein n=1 Tax=Ktedonobacter sp. SOSP1-85 TaxID=2778367 RepID=UPI0019161019|nr:hypothetical protein [Ktedonobacter sp. SOSP1-85]GHO74241.1 hypothetical protein KSD_20120 [Ktedonobacter sp. SOSP1-85]